MKARETAFLVLVQLFALSSFSHGQLNSGQQAVLEDIARGGNGSAWSGLSDSQAQNLTNKATAYMDNYMMYHLPDGLNADICWTNYNRTAVGSFPNIGYTGLGDSATWTGHYLAALALRYSVTGESALLGKINEALDSIDMLTRVSGRDGHLARHAIPLLQLTNTNSKYRAYYNHYGGDAGDPYLGEEAFNGSYNGTDYAWLGNQQRDAYACVNFGLATTLAKVNDSQIRDKVGNLIDRMVQRLKDDAVFGIWVINDGHRGSIFETPIVTPLLKAALLRTAATADPAKWGSEYASAAAAAPTTFDDTETSSYFVNNLNFNLIYSLNVLETNPSLKQKWEQAANNKWAQTADHLNAHFAAEYIASTGNTADMKAVAVLQGELADFPNLPRFNYHVENDPSADYADYALHITDRPPSDFIWQRSPFSLNGGSGQPEEFPGIDVFLPYWMGRDTGVIMVPEPSTLASLALLVLGGLALLRHRRVR